MSDSWHKGLLDITGNHIGLVFIITTAWVFAGILFYLYFKNVCVDSSLSAIEKFKDNYDTTLIIAAITAASIILSFFYNKTSIGHGCVLVIITFVLVVLMNMMYIFGISHAINQDICIDKDWKSAAIHAGILTGFTMLAVLLAMIITWLMFRSESYYNMGSYGNAGSSWNTNTSWNSPY